MTAKIGISSDFERRKQELCREYRNPRFKVLHEELSREIAQEMERVEAAKPNREAHSGGRPPDDPDADYTVYAMYHDGKL